MRLAAVSLDNFRSYRNKVKINLDDFTAILGRNDIGKSTILEALEIFFNNNAPKMDCSDCCVHTQNDVVEISCFFDDLPEILNIDPRSETTFQQEHLLNNDGQLEIVKRFECGGAKPKESIFLRANHPSADTLKDLLQLKNADLKSRAEDLIVDLEGVDKRSNVAIRQAIRVHIGDAQKEEMLLPLDIEDGKKAWTYLQTFLPTFALFQADRPSRDDDPEVSDPMSAAIKAAVKEVEPQLEEIRQHVQRSALDVARRTVNKIREMDPRLAQELNPQFKAEPKWDGFKLSLTGEDQVPINKRGSGVRRLILMNFFRAEVERRRAEATSPQVVYAIEEPESSQHPDNQVMLIKALMELANETHAQVIITTHVPAVAAMVPVESVRLVSRDEDGAPQIQDGGDDVYKVASESLGVLPDKRAQVGIYVEGPYDVSFLTSVSRTYRILDGTLIDFENDHRVAFIPTGGGNLKHWVNQQYLRNVGLKEVHIYDADDPHAPQYKPQIDEVNARGNDDIGFITVRREMENYLHADAVSEVYGINIVIQDWSDVPMLIAERVHDASNPPMPWAALNEEKKREKSSRAKRRLNTDVVGRMTLARLQQVDSAGEILRWFVAIRDRIN